MKIKIDLPHHPYDIQIEKGCLSQAGKWLRELWQPQKVVIITDNHVASLYAEKVKLSLEDAGFQVAVFDFLEGEERKNLTTVQKAYEDLQRDGFIETTIGRGSFVSAQNKEFYQEEQQRIAEEHLQIAAEIGRTNNISLSKLQELLTLFYMEDE